MRAEYKRDMNRNYLVLSSDTIDTNSYQVRMLVGNVVPSFLKCRIQGLDGKFMVYYDITSHQPLSVLYEQRKLQTEDLRLLLEGFVMVLEEMAEYLLNAGQLVIEPEYIYMDLEKRKVFFCFLPGFQKDVREQFRELTEYILPRLNHEDSQAVMLGYGVYRRALEDNFRLEHVKEVLYKTGKDAGWEGSGAASSEPEFRGTLTRRADPWSGSGTFAMEERSASPAEAVMAGERFGEDDNLRDARSLKKNPERAHGAQKKTKKNKGIWKIVAGCLAGAAVLFGVMGAKLLGFLPVRGLEVILGGIIACMGAGMLLYAIYKKRAEKKERSKPLVRKIKTGSEGQEGEKELREAGEEFQGSGTEFLEAAKEQVSAPTNRKSTDISGGGFGETVVLCENPVLGPATLVSREPGELATIYLQEELAVIGKLETAADVVINLPTVSRIHAKIRRRDGEYYLSDLNSRNGTFVNGQTLKAGEDYLLKEEDEVDFAQARYVFLK